MLKKFLNARKVKLPTVLTSLSDYNVVDKSVNNVYTSNDLLVNIGLCAGKAGLSLLQLPFNKLENHVLVSSDVGYGKTELLKSIVYSVTTNYTEDDVEVYIIADKSVEYQDFTHLNNVKILSDIGVITDTLVNIRSELYNRRKLIKDTKCTSVKEYNNMSNVKKPKILLLIDDLTYMNSCIATSSSSKTIEKALQIIYSISRVYGIYCVASVQSDLLDSIPSYIRCNVNRQIGFKVTDSSSFGKLYGCDVEYKLPIIKGRGYYSDYYNYDNLIEFQSLKISN